jgi:hypothetical protein
MHLFPIGSSVAWGVGTGLFVESADRTALLTSYQRLALAATFSRLSYLSPGYNMHAINFCARLSNACSNAVN